MRYRATVHHNGLQPGDEVDLTDQQVEDYAGEIDREFLVPVEDIEAWEPGYVMRDGTGAPIGASAAPEIPDREETGTGEPLDDETAQIPE